MPRSDCESHYWKEKNLYHGYQYYLHKMLDKELETYILEEFLTSH